MMKNVLGLDLGAHTIKAVELRQTLRGLEPVQLRIHPRPEGQPLAEELRRFVRMHGLSTEHVACALSGDRLSSRRLQFPFRDRKKLAQAVPFEVEGEIPFDLDEVVVDWQVLDDERNHAEVAALIAQRHAVADLLAEVKGAGFDVRIVEAEGFVLGNLPTLFDLPGNRMLVDIGHRKTTFCVLMNGKPIGARTIPVGGLHLTRAIARDRDLGTEEAERLKCEDGIFHLGFNSAAPSALPVLDRVAREAVRTLSSLEPLLGGSAESEIAGLTLIGGSAKLHRIDEYIAERTGIPTARLALPDSPEGQALVAGGDPLLFAPAIALALRSTASATTRVNFRQDELAYRTDFRQFFGRDLRWTAALASCALLLLGTSTATSITLDNRRARELEARVAGIYQEAFPNQPVPSNPIAAMRSAGEKAREKAEFLGVYGENQSALDLLGELSRRVPKDLEVKFEEVSIDRRVVRIKVFAKSFEAADRLTTELAKADVFRGAKVSGEIKAARTRPGKTFSLQIPLEVPGETS